MSPLTIITAPCRRRHERRAAEAREREWVERELAQAEREADELLARAQVNAEWHRERARVNHYRQLWDGLLGGSK